MRVTDLEPGVRYRVVRPFTDDRGLYVLEGDVQTVERVTHTPITGEISVVCREETLVFREDRQPDLVEHAERFFREA